MKTTLWFVGLGIYAECIFFWTKEALNMLNGDTMSALLGVNALLLAAVVTSFLVMKFGKRAIKAVGDHAAKNAPMVLLLLALPVSGCGCERVGAGHVGIKIELAGSARGVQSAPMVTGWVFYNKFTEDVLEYPTFVQTATWANVAGSADVPGHNEEISFNSKEGLGLTGDISLSYQLNADKVPAFYVKFRSDDLATFTHGYLRNVARDQLNDVAGSYAVEDLYGPKKETFVHEVKSRINAELASIGVSVEQFGFIGAPRPPPNVIAAINAKIGATQAAIQAENELRRAEAEARKQVAAADGAASSRVAMAEGEAKAKIAMAEGEAKANATLVSSITPALLEWRRLDIAEHTVAKWNGARPMIEGGAQGLMLAVPPFTGAK